MVSLGIVFVVLTDRFGNSAPAVIMLLFASVFALALSLPQAAASFRKLRKQFTWWHGLWLLVLLSGFQFRLRDTQAVADAAVDSWALYRISLMAITAFALGVRLALRRAPFTGYLRRGVVGMLTIYTIICAASTLWSVYPTWTLYKSLEYLVDIALLASILATFASVEGCKTVFDWTWTLDGLLLISVWLGAWLWPAEAFQPSRGLISVQLYGILPQIDANGVGHLSAILSIVALSRLLLRPAGRTGRTFYGVLFTLGLVTMAVTQTRSAILGFLFGLVLILYFSRRMGSIALLSATVILLFSLTSVGALAEDYVRRGQSPELVQSLSGRTDWWESGWQELAKNPWMGMGAYTARFTVLRKMRILDASTVHNTYLETILGVGIVGLIPLIAVFLWTWRLLIRELRDRFGSPVRRQLAIEALAVFAVITCRSFFSVPLITHPDLDSLAVLGYAGLLQRSWKTVCRASERDPACSPDRHTSSRGAAN
jgi:O-antigen ligase